VHSFLPPAVLGYLSQRMHGPGLRGRARNDTEEACRAMERPM